MKKKKDDAPEPEKGKEGILEKAEETLHSAEQKLEKQGKRTFLRITFKQAIMIVLALILIILCIVGWRIFTILSQDLSLTLSPEAAALQLAHSESANVEFTLRTNNLVFCTAECTYQIVQLSDGNITKKQEKIRMHEAYQFSLDVTAPEKGEGQLIFGVDVSCKNIKKALCARDEELHSIRSLVTIDYTLTDEEEKVRERTQADLPRILATARTIDEETQRVAAITEQLGATSLDGLEQEAATLKTTRDTIVRETEQLVALYTTEEYLQIGSTIESDITSTLAIAQQSRDLREKLERYVDAQHALVIAAMNATALLTHANAAYATIIAFGNTSAEYRTAASSTATQLAAIAQEPGRDVFSRTALLAETLRTLRMNDETARTLLQQDIVGAAIREETARLLVLKNVSDPKEPILPPIPNDLVRARMMTIERCEALRNVTRELALLNVTPLAATLALDEPCPVIEQLAFVVPLPAVPKSITVVIGPIATTIPSTLPEHVRQCCIFGSCTPCCNDASCRKIPVLFLHGHSSYVRNDPSYSAETFQKFQMALEHNGTRIDAGVLTPYSTYVTLPTGGWSEQRPGVSASGTYYYDAYLSGGSYILSTAKSESIDTYAIRLKDIVETLRQRAGTDQVIVVAHSMGGLVARRYLQLFGTEHVAALIMIGTPNNGVESSVATLCPLIGASKECEEIKVGSSYLAKLNDPSQQPNVPTYMIIGAGCDMGDDGDGVVKVKNARLPGATNRLVNGTCTSTEKLHNTLLDPERYPEVFATVEGLLADYGQ